MKNFTTTLAASLLGASMLTGAAYAATVAAGDTLAADQTFTYTGIDEFSSLDPQIVEDVSGSEVIRDLFEGLMNQDAEGNLIPGVATGYDVSDDRLTYTFHLRDNAKWSDGKPVTAGDFVYGWRRLVDPATASPYSWYGELMAIEGVGAVMAGDATPDTLGVKAIDDTTLEVKLTAPLPYFPQMVVHASTFPSPQWAIEEFGDSWTDPEHIVSNGAYVLTEHVAGERTVRERNPMYWNNDETVIEKVVYLIIGDENTALTRYLAGELDRAPVPTGQYPRLAEEYPDQAASFPSLCTYYYTFNMTESGPEAFRDVRVRQALSYALDRSVITEKVTQGGQIQAYTFTPGATAGFNVPDVAYASMSQDERNAAANALLADAGYGSDNPLSFTLLYNTSEGHKKIAIAASQLWKSNLGVSVELANMEWKTFLEERGNQNFDMARGGWCGDYNEASTFLDLLTSTSGYNDGKFASDEVDQLMADAKFADDAAPNYTRVEEILAAEMPVIPIYHYTSVAMMNPKVKNWPVNNVQQNWYSRDLYIAE